VNASPGSGTGGPARWLDERARNSQPTSPAAEYLLSRLGSTEACHLAPASNNR
jgi:hypothetical protein